MIKFIDFNKLSAFSTAEQSPGFLFWRAHLIWKRNIEAALEPHDLTHVQFVLLAGIGYLAKDGAAVAQNDLAKFTFCDVTMTSQVLRSLEKKKMIKRVHKEGDVRAKYPMLTDEGLKTLKNAMKAVEKTDKVFFSVLNKNVPIVDIFTMLAKQ